MLQEFVKDTPEGRQETSDPERGLALHQPEQPTRTVGRLVINTIAGGPHPADKNWQEMERYANSLRHTEHECCSNVEDGTPAKQQRTMHDDIVFRNRDADKVEGPTIDPLVISATIGPTFVRRILIDCGSSVNIIFKKAYDQMKLETKDFNPSKARIHGFNGAATDAVGYVELPVELGQGECRRVRILPFIVLDDDSPYNVFLG